MNRYVYIITNKTHSTLYIGVSHDLKKRMWEHKNKIIEGFSKRYNLNKLVYFEHYEDYEAAANRERRLKKWNRAWKERLINEANPKWNDLYDDL